RGCDPAHGIGGVPTERRGDVGERRVPRDRLTATERRGETTVVVDEPVAVAALVAQPPFVHIGVEPRLEPRHAFAAGVVRAPAIDVDLDVAATSAAGADGLGGVEVPDADLEAEVA